MYIVNAAASFSLSQRLIRARPELPASALARPYLCYEYFYGDNGAGIGASHQTGWRVLVAELLQQSGEKEEPYAFHAAF